MKIEDFVEKATSDIEDRFMKIDSLTHENYVKLFEEIKVLVKSQIYNAYEAGRDDLGNKLAMTNLGRRALEQVDED